MNMPVSTASSERLKLSRFQNLCRQLLLRQLAAIQEGCLIFQMSNQAPLTLGQADHELKVRLTVTDPRFFEAVIFGGSVGAAESYMAGDWHSDDLTALIRLLVRNRDLVDGMEKGLARITGWLLQGVHWLRRNTRDGSRKNIAAHYDLGNDLFELFLDRDFMMYSSGLYYDDSESLERAQFNKLGRLCDKLDLQPDDHLLEIGTGWGGCATFAALHYGCRVTTTTISREQYEHARRRVADLDLEDKVTVLLEDYRDLKGQYDKLISIEMVEAVGHHFINDYFQHCSQLLKPNGLAIIQAITLEDHRYRQAVKSVDFIKRYIFPGSFIPCVSVLVNAAASAELKLTNLEDIGPSYATTLSVWRERFMAQLDEVRRLGYDERFIRMWEFYLCYCEGGFMERSISDVHLLFSKPANRREQWVPLDA
ncbi:SAM-dependent methyltransferase [Methylophaga sp. OBS1]|uniref:SAM-dependent methyltransferase n=1 Tax=Methylophaga sp. OBS1 TaxID=2991933 RepID=UPI0022537EE3|nr:cyclopropane-fatty-acyl-phospholipid synthase family protein [Methylophaga sp. OBS1]MCX4190886.1 cyclopropane-fatty-acyl-phospholipid synthase family protein [Methylophaga sp. OBS1]MCX4192167.1 cyclopropane-fatty-acyl-phospholipid synthase family protein [Methylophaga sp. OBS1]